MVRDQESGKIRIDKWLWAARFFKTRSMAAQAVRGGRVHVNDNRVKPAHGIASGDMLRIRRGEVEFVVQIVGVSDRRRPAVEARDLYQETENSIAAREGDREKRRLLAGERMFGPVKRPDKRERRKIMSFTRRQD